MRPTTHVGWARASLPYLTDATPAWPWRLRLRVWSRRFQLDEALASGADPLSGQLLTLRAHQLTAMHERRIIARSLGLVLRRSRQSPPASLNAVPLDRGAIETVEDELRDIHRRLLAPERVGVQGVALALLMVRDGGSPLYNRMAATSLRALVARVLRALDEPRG